MALEQYAYYNPDADAHFSVEPVTSSYPRILEAGRAMQTIMHYAWITQFNDRFSPEDISKTVDPTSINKVSGQIMNLRTAGDLPWQSSYVVAVVYMPTTPETTHITAFGKANEIPKRLFRRSALADVSNVFVHPGFQSNGMGSAILRSLLDRFHEDIPTAVYDFPFNKRTVETLGRLGFGSKKTWQEDYFGQTVDQTWFEGPPVGELKVTLEQRKPWLSRRRITPQE